MLMVGCVVTGDPGQIPLAPLNSRILDGQRGSRPVPPSAFKRDPMALPGTGRSRPMRALSQGRSGARFSGKGRGSNGRTSPRSQQMPSPFAAAPGGPRAAANGPSALANGPSLPQLPEIGPAPRVPADELGPARLSFRDILKAGRPQNAKANGAAAIIPPWEGHPDWAVSAQPLCTYLHEVASRCWPFEIVTMEAFS